MTAVSASLRAAREREGRTIEDISASTKIGVATLVALERGDFSKLPGDFYTRAFLRTYARELHLSPDAIANQFESDRLAAHPSASDRPIREAAPAPASRQATPWEPSLRAPWPQVMAIATNAGVVIAVVVFLLVVTVTRSRSVAPRPPEPGAVGTGGVAAVPAASAAAATPVVPVEKLVIEIQAAGAIWVTGAADGKRVLYRLLAPGDRVRVEANDTLAFRVGDAASFSYSINGVPGKTLGGSGEVRDVQITRENYRTFQR